MKWLKRLAMGFVKPIVLAAAAAAMSEGIDHVKGEIKDPRLRAGADAALLQIGVRFLERLEDGLDKVL